MKDEIKLGDHVFFHHSSTIPPGIVGICEVVKTGFPDEAAFNPQSAYFDSKSTRENPRWFAVKVKLVKKFESMVSLPDLKKTPGLEKMMVCQRGARLSIQPVTPSEWSIVCRLAGVKL